MASFTLKMRKKDVIDKPCFSCGSEAADWMCHNCDNCIKASRTKDGINYTKGRCVYQQDIERQWLIAGEVRKKTYELTRKWECALRQEHYPKRHKGKDDSPELFSEEDFKEIESPQP